MEEILEEPKQILKFYNQAIYGSLYSRMLLNLWKHVIDVKWLGKISKRQELPLTNILEIELVYEWGIDFVGLSPISLVICTYLWLWIMYLNG